MYETTDQLLAEISDRWVKDPRSNMYKLIDSYNAPLEQISDMANRVEEWRAIADAEGTTLDLFGKDIETYRPTKEDPPYRFLIYLKTLLARAQGTIPSIVKITGSALGSFDGIKIWNEKTPRHVGIALPFDRVNSWPIEKFIIDNLQRMLALGYWLDEIVFVSKTESHLYIGTATTDRWDQQAHERAVWWTGWKSKATGKPLYIGTVTQSGINDRAHQHAVWWTGWKSKTAGMQYGATVTNVFKYGRNHEDAVWWTDPHDTKSEMQVSVGAVLKIEDKDILN